MSHEQLVIARGTHATVYAERSRGPSTANGAIASGGLDNWHAKKVVYGRPKDSRRRPHDFVREIQVLKVLQHPNVVQCLSCSIENEGPSDIIMPLLACTLAELLKPQLPWSNQCLPVVFRSIAFQLLIGLAYMHEQGVSHRDIKPNNIMLGYDCILRYIDLGTCWTEEKLYREGADEEGWSEKRGDMVCDVGTGAYRAPELLFGPRQYDARAVDIWALGCVLAEFFTSSNPVSDPSDRSDAPPAPQRDIKPRRPLLFDGSFGDLGLAASIFRIRGSPTPQRWPVSIYLRRVLNSFNDEVQDFGELPDADKVQFESFAPKRLRNLIPGVEAMGVDHVISTVELLEKMLSLPPSQRISAGILLESSLILEDLILVPPTLMALYDSAEESGATRSRAQNILVGELDGLTWRDLVGWELDQAKARIEALSMNDDRADSDSDW